MDPESFSTRSEFRKWLEENCTRSEGIWLTFSKLKDIKTLKPSEAVEEALCFGWIDSIVRTIDDRLYKEYFSPRRKKSKWSETNKALAERLEREGLMTDHGRAKIEEAHKNGTWDAPQKEPITAQMIDDFAQILTDIEPAYTNFLAMSPASKRGFADYYFDAKQDATRQRRLVKIIEALNKNQRPMF